MPNPRKRKTHPMAADFQCIAEVSGRVKRSLCRLKKLAKPGQQKEN